MKRAPNYSAEDDAIIREHYATMSAEAVGKMIGRGASSVRERARKLELSKVENFSASRGLQITLPESEREYIRQHWPTTGSEALKKVLKRSRPVIEREAAEMGLVREPRAVKQAKAKSEEARIAKSRPEVVAPKKKLTALKQSLPVVIPDHIQIQYAAKPVDRYAVTDYEPIFAGVKLGCDPMTGEAWA